MPLPYAVIPNPGRLFLANVGEGSAFRLSSLPHRISAPSYQRIIATPFRRCYVDDAKCLHRKRSSRHEQSTNTRATTQDRTDRSAHVAGQPKGIGPAWTQETKSKNVCKCPKALPSIPNASAGAHSVDLAYLYPPFLSHICHPLTPTAEGDSYVAAVFRPAPLTPRNRINVSSRASRGTCF